MYYCVMGRRPLTQMTSHTYHDTKVTAVIDQFNIYIYINVASGFNRLYESVFIANSAIVRQLMKLFTPP